MWVGGKKIIPPPQKKKQNPNKKTKPNPPKQPTNQFLDCCVKNMTYVFSVDFKNTLRDMDELIRVCDYISLDLSSQSYFLARVRNFIFLLVFWSNWADGKITVLIKQTIQCL